MAVPASNDDLPTATAIESLGILAGIVTPTVAKGAIIRRPRVVGASERLDTDRRAIRRMQGLRARYGTGPLMLRMPMRSHALILDPTHVFRVLEGSPEPFATASSEKRAALAHFQPKGVLISHGREREDRRRFNAQVLQSDDPAHRLADRFLAVVDEEADHLLREVRTGEGLLDWDRFSTAWFRVVRRVVFGNGARDDHELRDLIDRLRHRANWAFLKPKRRQLRARFLERLESHLERAEPGSLAEVVASVPRSRSTAPEQQVPQWLFAFDPAGMTTFRTLALLTTHPEHAERAREEIRSRAGDGDAHLSYLRACVLESLRLWPTTPMVLRETTEATIWDTGTMPAGTGILIFSPFFHRDDERLTYADRLSPELWLRDRAEVQGLPPEGWPLIPFSAGPAVCPGRNLVLLVSSRMLTRLLEPRRFALEQADRLDRARLPGVLNHYSLRFRLAG
jgi:cytochrome P450